MRTSSTYAYHFLFQCADVTQFQGFFNFPDMQTLLKHFCVYHINGVGQEEGAAPLPQM